VSAANGNWTMIVAVPLRPLHVAVMVAVPGATAVTNPAGLTAAIVGSDELHVAVWPTTG
jgi:hypothetical protein